MVNFKHEYLRCPAFNCLSLSSPFCQCIKCQDDHAYILDPRIQEFYKSYSNVAAILLFIQNLKKPKVKHFYNDYCTHLTSKQSEVNETFNVNDTLEKWAKIWIQISNEGNKINLLKLALDKLEANIVFLHHKISFFRLWRWKKLIFWKLLLTFKCVPRG